MDPRDVFKKFEAKQTEFGKALDALAEVVGEMRSKLNALGQPATATLEAGVAVNYATKDDIEALAGRLKVIEDGFSAAAEALTSTGPSILTTELSSGQVGQGYSAALSANGGTPPYVWSISGALPAGVTFDTTAGVIAGTPSEAGTFPLSIGVYDALGVSGSASLSLVVAEAVQTEQTTDQGGGDQGQQQGDQGGDPQGSTEQPQG